MYFGYSECVITPGRNIGLAGYPHRPECGFNNSGVLDDLYAGALALKLGDTELIVVAADLCVMEPEDADRIRQAASSKTGVPVERIMLALSHTHSGPVTSVGYTEVSQREAEAIREYMDGVVAGIAAICAEARSRLGEAKVYSATYRAVLGFNRRYPERDEKGNTVAKMLFSMWQNPGHETEGTLDPDIPVLVIERVSGGAEDSYLSQNGYRRVVLFSAPYHPVVLGQQNRFVSADYVGAARRCLTEVLGSRTAALFLYAPSGNVEPALAVQNNPQAVQVVGNAIGYGIATILALRREVSVDSLDSIEEDVVGNASLGTRIKTHVFRIGDACIVGVSGECFAELGMQIRQASPFAQTLVATNANGGRGYLPVKEAFAQGGHEVESALGKGYDGDLFETVVGTLERNIARMAGALR